MKRPFYSVAFGLILLTTVVLPSVLRMVFHASSMAAGTIFVLGMYIFLFVAVNSKNLGQSQRWSAGTFRLVAGMLCVVVIHGSVSFLFNHDFDFSRFMQSYLLLIIYSLGALSFVLLAQKVSKFQIDFAVKLVFYVLLLSSIAGILHFSPFSPELIKAVFFFTEPSHFALSFLPFLLYMTVTSSPRVKLLLVLFGYVAAYLLENMTFVVGITLIAGLVFPVRRLLFFVSIAVILIFYFNVNLDYYMSRGVLYSGSQNLSSLVYLSGWERAYLNFKDTFGIGVGFQQFGIIGSRGEIMASVEALAGSELNLLDGGAVAPKLIGEFGGVGVGVLIVYFVYFVKNLWEIRSKAMSRFVPQDYKQVFFRSCFLMYSVDLFVRGSGYFTSEGFMFFASIIWLLYFDSRKLDGEVVPKTYTSW